VKGGEGGGKNLNGLNGVKEGNKSGRLLYYYTYLRFVAQSTGMYVSEYGKNFHACVHTVPLIVCAMYINLNKFQRLRTTFLE
jgi:hypothetical protein